MSEDRKIDTDTHSLDTRRKNQFGEPQWTLCGLNIALPVNYATGWPERVTCPSCYKQLTGLNERPL